VRKNPETPVHLETDHIAIEGKEVGTSNKAYWMLNKPRGVVTTKSDEKGRDTVYRYLQDESTWLAPVGRLDKASEGLLLFTNDSEWAAAVLAPETHLDKTYHVHIAALATDTLLRSLTKGAKVDGELLRVKSAAVLRGGARNTWLELVLDEGKNRHIRRLFAHFNIEVLRLIRIAIGPLALGDLGKGERRPLTESEKRGLDEAMAQKH
jgi:23S rRNA pseudouridine2605 synthase